MCGTRENNILSVCIVVHAAEKACAYFAVPRSTAMDHERRGTGQRTLCNAVPSIVESSHLFLFAKIARNVGRELYDNHG